MLSGDNSVTRKERERIEFATYLKKRHQKRDVIDASEV